MMANSDAANGDVMAISKRKYDDMTDRVFSLTDLQCDSFKQALITHKQMQDIKDENEKLLEKLRAAQVIYNTPRARVKKAAMQAGVAGVGHTTKPEHVYLAIMDDIPLMKSFFGDVNMWSMKMPS